MEYIFLASSLQNRSINLSYQYFTVLDKRMNFPVSLVKCRAPVTIKNEVDARGRNSFAEKMRDLKRSAGFTLIELCSVVTIISILAGISMFGIQSYRDRAKVAQARADLDRIAKAIVMLQLDTGKWPGGQSPGLPASGSNEVSNLNAASAGLCAPNNNFPNWSGPYYSPCPIPPDPWGKDYIFDTDYYVTPSEIRVAVHSGGPNQSGVNVYDDDNVIKILQ